MNIDRLSIATIEAEEKHNLSSFLPWRLDSLPTLPIEFLNEPYAYHDNGYRLEMTLHRPRFRFTVKEGDREMKPEKKSTNFSVVNVYDSYGLDMTYAFLSHIYLESKRSRGRDWLAAYLQASLSVLDSEIPEDDDPLRLSSLLLSKLSILDEHQPRALGLLAEAPELPLDILAKIINSYRISKSLSAAVRGLRSTTIPSELELSEFDHPATMRVHDRYILIDAALSSDLFAGRVYEDFRYRREVEWGHDSSYLDAPLSEYENVAIREWSLQVERGSIYTVKHLSADEVKDDECEGFICQYSLEAYERVFRRRGCDGRLAVIAMLQNLSSRLRVVNESNIEDACGWIVQLSYQCEKLEMKVMIGYEQLRDKLQELIRSALVLLMKRR